MHAPHVIPVSPSPMPPPAPKPATPPRPNANAAAKPGSKPDEGGGLRVLTYLRLHWLMILFCGALLGTAGAFAAWELLASKYESYALMQVSSVPATIGNANNPNQARTDFVTYLKTTSALIKSEFVLSAALRDMKDLPTIKAQKNPIKFLDEELMVTWQDGSEVVRITFKSHEPADAKKIVDAVLAAFMKEVVQKDVKEKEALLVKVEEKKHDIQKILLLKSERERPATAKGPNAAPGTPPTTIPAGGIPNQMPAGPDGQPGALPPLIPAGGVGGAPANPNVPALPGSPSTEERLAIMDPRILLTRITGLMQQAEQLPFAIIDNKRQLAQLQQKLEAVKAAPISKTTLDAVEKDQDIIVQMIKRNHAQGEYQFRANAANDKSAPAIVALWDKWQGIEAELIRLRKEKAETIESVKRIAEAQRIAADMEELIRRLQRQIEQLDWVKTALARAEKQLAELPLPEKRNGNGIANVDAKEPAGYRPEASDLDTTDGIYRRLVQQFYLTQMELSSPARVRPLQQGSNPIQKELKKQVMGTVFAGLMGFGLIALGVVAFETMSKRVSSLADVKSASPMPVVGVIPCLPTDAMGRDPAKRAAANEAIDKLRSHVAQTWLSRGATCVAVTSALGDEGKAFAAFGLASSLAQSGYKTLLVDFDLREPRMHEFAGVPNLLGVCELLRAETDARSALQFLPSGLHLLPAGKWSDEARKAATGEKLETLLSKLKGPYDCVILHGHALLTAAESVEVARRCEVVLVCASYRETTTPMLKKAADRIATMEIPYSGVVYVGATGQESLC